MPTRGGRPKAQGANSKRPRDPHPTNDRIWSGGNHILAALPPDELAGLRQCLTPIAFASGDILYQQHSRIDRVYFPETAVASLVNRMADGAAVEVGTIGNEGAVGLDVFLGAD